MDRHRLQDLHSKYVELVALRTDPLEDAPMRARMRQLAARFPGSLRELDQLPIETLRGRRAEVAAALEAGVPAPWMEALLRYHDGMRLALALRRGVPDRTLQGARAWWTVRAREHFEDEGGPTTPRPAPSRPSAALPPLDDGDLETLLRPPGGRLHHAVMAWLVRADVGFDTAALERLLGATEHGETTEP